MILKIKRYDLLVLKFLCLIFYIFFFSNILKAEVKIVIYNIERCFFTDSTPHHMIGQFPTKGNPNVFKKQNLKFCTTLKPVINDNFSYKAKTVGITLSGIPIRPNTADWYDPKSPKGHSKKNTSGWNLEGITPYKKKLGIDSNNGHVDKNGLYHYHAANNYLLNLEKNSLIGYAADGHEIHYLGSTIRSSWKLKNGKRPTMPFGNYDGSFFQDYEFIEGSGDLDECNFGKINDQKVYFATNEFPFFPRCLWGNPSRYFLR